MMKHTPIELSQEAVSRQLIELVYELARMQTHTAESAAGYLSNYYHGHLYLAGEFSAKTTCFGYDVVTFSGTICGEQIGHEISFY